MTARDLVMGAAGGASAPSDPNFKNVSLLLTGDGTNGSQNNTFLDSSTNNFTITRNGNTTQGTFSPYGSLWSNYFDGSGDGLYGDSNVAYAFGTGDFTIECWLYQPASDDGFIASSRTSATNGWLISIMSGTFGFGKTGIGNQISSPTAFPTNQWVHIVAARQSGTVRIFENGIQKASGTDTTDFATYGVQIGSNRPTDSGWDLNGYISNLRIVKGTALYTSNFTPSTTPLTAVSGTSLLTCQSNRFIDNSSNNFTLTVNGNTSVQRFSPFNPTAPYSAATIGGSGYFDGSGDYLNTPATGQFAPTGDFTVGVWYYPLALPTYSEIVGNYTGSTSVNWIIEVVSTGQLNFYTNGASIRIQSAAGDIKIGQWHYIALCRSGTTITGYLNGTSLGTYTQSGTFGSATKAIYIGSQNGGYLMNGYLSDVKLIDGSAVTTVPTAPMTATSGTNLLLNFTNAGIPDAAMMNDLETIGNAQVSTSVKKYGTGSLAFDGTGDYLNAPTGTSTNFGTGDFTIEYWFYRAGNGSNSGFLETVIDTRTSDVNNGGGFVLGTASGNYVVTYGFPINTGPLVVGSFTAGAWNHVAFCQQNGTAKIYINGTLTYSASNSGANYNHGGLRIGSAFILPYSFNGYIDDLRITKGYARYTSNFTPPAQALPTN